jgi:hypothetical protein
MIVLGLAAAKLFLRNRPLAQMLFEEFLDESRVGVVVAQVVGSK